MSRGGPAWTDDHLIDVVVHDLRNAVNSIQLSVHLVESGVPADADRLRADIAALVESVQEARLMVEVLGHVQRLSEPAGDAGPEAIATMRMLEEAIGLAVGGLGREPVVVLNVEASHPAEVRLSPALAVLGLEHALRNAIAARRQGVIRVSSAGTGAAWRITIASEEAPMPSVAAGAGVEIKHLVGSPHDRRDLNLAIAARASERLGGTARLELEPGVRSQVVLEWPLRGPG